MAIFRVSEAFNNSVKKLQEEGYRFPTVQELPVELRMAGGESFMMSDQGQFKSIHQATGEIKDVKLRR